MNTNLITIKQKAVPILKKAGATRSSLFGSYVRGEQTEDSDIDILVELPQSLSLLDIVGVQVELVEALGKKVDLIEFTAIKPQIRERILQEQVSIL